jgi:putative ABC transport system permease protein
MISRLLADARIAARSLAKAPRFTLVAVLTLSLGIGANTAIFSVVNGVLLEPLPYPSSDRLVNVWSNAPGLGYDLFPLSPDVYFMYQRESAAFEEMALYQNTSGSITEDGAAERVRGALATHTLFSTLGIHPAMGRAYTAAEDRPEALEVVVLSHALWQRRYGGDPGAVGRVLRLDGSAREIIGVMPERFDFPGGAEYWVPLGIDPEEAPTGSFSYRAIGRLAVGVTPEAARAGLVPIVTRLREGLASEDAPDYAAFMEAGQYAPLVHRIQDDLVGDLEQPLWILLGTVGFVLLIACANVANLVLIRSEVRRRETAVRVAVGATRSSLARYLLTESALVAGAGAALGVLVAWVGVPLVLQQAPPQVPRLGDVRVDGVVLAFAALLGSVSAVLFGLPPALRFTRPGALAALKQGGRGSTGSARGTGRRLLVIGQTSLALVLLIGSGLLVRSFQRILSADLGFESADRITFGVYLPPARYPEADDVVGFHERLQARLMGMPRVRSAGFANVLPLSGNVSGTAHVVESRPTEPGELPPMLHFAYVGPGYMETMGIRLREGRFLTPSDHRDGCSVAVVSSAVADRFWPDGGLGQRLRLSGDPDNWFTVVGVVEPAVQESIREEPRPVVYYPLVQPDGTLGDIRAASYVVEAPDPLSLASDVRAAVWELDPDLPVADMRMMDEIVSSSVVELSFTMFTLGIAALLALVLGAVGLYGVLSYSVAQRTQEIGVRMALGAERGQVLGMIVRDGARTQVIGVAIGLVGAAALTRVLQGLLFGVDALDPITFVATSGILFAVGLLAAYLPARRAARLDPVTSMRTE